VVVIVRVTGTGVGSVAAAIDAGLNTQFVNACKLLHAKLTLELNVAPPTGAAENVKLALCPARTVAEALPVSVHVTSVPTVSVSVGVEFVSVPSVAWIWKLNVPGVALPNVTVNGTPHAVGVTVCGEMVHVPGAPGVPTPTQLRVTLPLYPSNAVNAPFQITF
jgi:hypothetical protein